MNKSVIAAIVATLYLVFYTLIPHAFIDLLPLFFLLFALSPLLVLWLVYTVLTDKNESTKTFSEGYWYADQGKKTNEMH